MPNAYTIPFRQASGNGHYISKQLPDNNADFLAILGLPTSIGNVTSVTTPSRDGQLATFWQTSGVVIKGSALIGIVDLVDGVVTTRTSPQGEIVGTLGAQTLNNKTLTGCALTSPTGLSKADVGLANVDNTSDANKPVSSATTTALSLKEDKANKGVANGYASLDATGKIPAAVLPTAVVGAVVYQGTWNALSNNPVIPLASAANKGWYYTVSIAGTTAVDGINDWQVNDWIISNGTTWGKVDNTDAVASVAGRSGVVVLTKADVGLDQVDNTSDATKNAAAVALTNKTINGNVNTLTVRLNADVVGNLPPSNLDGGAGSSSATFWRGDGRWGTPAGGGDVSGPGGASIDGEVALFNGTSGSVLRRGSGTGLATVTSGVYQTPTVKPSGAIVGTTDVQTLSNKTISTKGVDLLPGGLIVSNHTAVTQTSTGSTTVWSVNLPANMMNKTGDALRMFALWTSSGTTVNRSIILYLDAAIIQRVDHAAAAAVVNHMIYTIARTAATTVNIICCRTTNTGIMDATLDSPVTWDHSIAHTLRCDVYVATGSGQVSRHYGSTLEFLPLI